MDGNIHRSLTSRELGARLRRVREARYGPDGGPALAAALGVPAATLANYESGVSIPGRVLLAFLEITGANPNWLLTGAGEPFLGGNHKSGPRDGRSPFFS